MFSGLYPHSLGKVAHVRMGIDPLIRMLPQYLGAAGYRTGIVGKTHLWPPDKDYGSEFASLTIDRHLSPELGEADAYLCYLAEHDLRDAKDESKLPLELYRALWAAREARRFFEGCDERPFFLFCSFVKPHPPLDPPRPYDTYYAEANLPEPRARESELSTKPSAVRNKMDREVVADRESRQRQTRRFYGLMTLIDRAIGDIVDALGESGRLENTIILFTSDHGDYMGDHYLTGKEFFHEPSAGVPFILSGPGIASGKATDALAGHVDILPTFLELAGAEVPNRLEGCSLAPVLRDPEVTVRDVIFGELHRGIKTPQGVWWTGQKMAATQRHKYIYYSRAWQGEGFEEELYDLQRDPHEFDNLADTETETCREMRDLILAWQVDTQVNQLYPEDDRYPLTFFDPKSGGVAYAK